MMDIDEMEWKDAVFSIPKETAYAELKVKIMENGELVTLARKMSPSEINNAFKLFDDTVNGDYPFYVLTEEGEKYLESLKNGEVET